MKSTVINTSKEMMAFSDYPPPDNFAIYMHNTKVLEYTRNYAEHFHLMENIRFARKVVSVRKTDDFSTSGRWTVEWKEKLIIVHIINSITKIEINII